MASILLLKKCQNGFVIFNYQLKTISKINFDPLQDFKKLPFMTSILLLKKCENGFVIFNYQLKTIFKVNFDQFFNNLKVLVLLSFDDKKHFFLSWYFSKRGYIRTTFFCPLIIFEHILLKPAIVPKFHTNMLFHYTANLSSPARMIKNLPNSWIKSMSTC